MSVVGTRNALSYTETLSALLTFMYRSKRDPAWVFSRSFPLSPNW